MDLKARISEATKVAMKAREKERVAALRLIGAEIKRVEVDERKELDDLDVLAVLDRMRKQRNDSLTQFRQAGRDDLADKEQFELDLIQEFLPQPLDPQALAGLVEEAVVAVGATSMQDMGKVMAHLKPQIQGRADMGQVSGLVKARLG